MRSSTRRASEPAIRLLTSAIHCPPAVPDELVSTYLLVGPGPHGARASCRAPIAGSPARRVVTSRNMASHGLCSARFEPVREEFERNLAERGEIGAAVCVTIDGETVVDLWGGLADPA